MERERKGKSILIGVLCAIILVMSIGFANFTRQLEIEGTASVGSTWNVQITSITKVEGTGEGVTEVAEPTKTAASATFNVEFAEPGQSIQYKVVVTNLGTIPAMLTKITESDDTGVEQINFEISGVEENAKLAAGATHEYIVTVTYPETAIGENAPTNDASETVTYTLDYAQDTAN